MHPYSPLEQQLARAVLQLADDGGMPDSFWESDYRIATARRVLGVPEDGRYTDENKKWHER